MIAFESIKILAFNLVVKSVESNLIFETSALESINILAFSLVVKSVESDLSLSLKTAAVSFKFVIDALESFLILSRIELILSTNAVLAVVPKAVILFERDAVSLSNLLLNIVAVSEIFSFKLILLLNAVSLVTNKEAIVVESALSFVVMAVESKRIFALRSATF